VILSRRWLSVVCLVIATIPFSSRAQIDPVERKLLQVGYSASFEGHAPLAMYAFYYYNKPEFLSNTNLTLRLAVAPTYIDSELGFTDLFGPNTDLGIGLAGGGYADSYLEIQKGKYIPQQSFEGHGGEFSLSLYHRFNPGAMIPLNGVLRATAHYSLYAESSDTDPTFQLPDDEGFLKVRTGLRWGGKEPTLFPALAMELSAWYQGEFRLQEDTYGFADNPYKVNRYAHLFWGEALLGYALTNINHSFFVSVIGGSSVDADRFSAYRLGALLPMVSEFPLSLPGYYYQELSAKGFVLFGANYLIALDKAQRWSLDINGATSYVDYIPGLEQSNHENSGVGAGILYKTPSFKVMLGYGYGVDAHRSHGRGANSIGILMQLDWSKAKNEMFNPAQPSLWQGMQRVFGLFGQ
jgi:hypothetical protein